MKRRVRTAYIADHFGCEIRTAERWCALGAFTTARKWRGLWYIEKEEVDRKLETAQAINGVTA